MYTPQQYSITDQSVIDEFIRTNDFATLITCEADGVPFATHIPLTLKTEGEQRILIGHVARGNHHWKLLQEKRPTLAIFHGPHSYISARWYDHENVPTWNYQVVHAYCTPEIFTHRDALHEAVDTLTKDYEHGTGYTVDGLSERLVDTELRGIVGFRLTVERFEAKFKLSQNHGAESHANVIKQLEASDSAASRAVAEAMKRHTPF
jgi:transcriptional regulator